MEVKGMFRDRYPYEYKSLSLGFEDRRQSRFYRPVVPSISLSLPSLYWDFVEHGWLPRSLSEPPIRLHRVHSRRKEALTPQLPPRAEKSR